MWKTNGSAEFAEATWSVVHAERSALIEDLGSLADGDWNEQSLCPGWTVHDVLAHLVNDAKTTTLGFLQRFAGAGFNFDRCNEQGVERERRPDPRATLDAFAAASRRTSSAPAPLASRLVEILVHGEDIRRPLGIAHRYPPEAAITALRYQLNTTVKMGGAKEKAQGLRLVATDAEIAVGAGPEVKGTACALLIAASGRPVLDVELEGPGVAQLLD